MQPTRFCHFPALPVPRGLPVTTAPPRPCPYLAGRTEVSRGLRCDRMPGWLYQELMDAGFRRSGRVFYQLACPHCRECVPLRVPVERFRPSRRQRRVARANRDLAVRIGRPIFDAERHELYVRYLDARHDRMMSRTPQALDEFLCRSPGDTIEVVYRDPVGRLLGVGICDLTPTALSTVYFYFEPEAGRRGLGTYSSLREVEIARSLGLRYYYLGFWVKDCPRMQYKNRFRPYELLAADGQWRAPEPGVLLGASCPPARVQQQRRAE